MEFTGMEEVQHLFPDSYYDVTGNRIRGELSFTAIYDGRRLHLNPSKSSSRFKEFSGCYEIEIDLNHRNRFGFPPVWEVGGKLEAAAKRRSVELSELHVNGDGTCCLSFFSPLEARNFSLFRFVKEMVFGYFAWHAYWNVFNKKPPWGEYSHQNAPAEKEHEIRTLGRNDPCFCGSGKKYKHCCLTHVDNMRRGRY